MACAHVEQRIAIGRTLRRLRMSGSLSLDDIETMTRDEGDVVVTRSHLSRVETGQADIALPRFLGLMRALGEQPTAALDEIESQLAPQAPTLEWIRQTVAATLKTNDLTRAIRLLRLSFPRSTFPWPDTLRWIWIALEVRAGRWLAAERAARATRWAARPWGLGTSAIISLGTGDLEIAAAVASRSSTPENERDAGDLVVAASVLEQGHPSRAAELIQRVGPEPSCGPVGAAAAVLMAEAFRRAHQLRAALRVADKACELITQPALKVEACLVKARICGDLRRPGAGLRVLKRATRAAREHALVARLADVHRHAAVLHRIDGDRLAAASAERTRRALRRRVASEATSNGTSLGYVLFEAIACLLDESDAANQNGINARTSSSESTR